MENEYIASIRKEYEMPIIGPEDFPNEPVQAFKYWFDLAIAEEVDEVNAMVLSTVDAQNRPHSRIVLLKDITDEGLVFFTNYQSKKGHNLEKNPYACVNFYWQQMARQIRVEGKVQKVSEEVSDEYFQSRPRLSQAGAIVSHQSKEIASREEMDAQMEKLMALPETELLKRPTGWGGYCLVPDYFEFWQGRPGRVHDRIAYELKDGHWRKFRLSP